MNVRAITVFFWGFLIAGAAMAGEEYRSEIKIHVESDGEEPQIFEWHSDDPDADFSTLEVGESKTLTGDDGREVKVTRTEDGLEVNVDGKVMFLDGSELGDAAQVHGEHEVIIRKAIEKTTN